MRRAFATENPFAHAQADLEAAQAAAMDGSEGAKRIMEDLQAKLA